MPRTYKRKPGASKYTVTPLETLTQAFEDLERGMSQREACAKYKITCSHFQNFVKEQRGERRHRLLGHPTAISHEVELALVDHLIAVSDWGFPFDTFDLRMAVKRLLDIQGTDIPMFKGNLPGEDWALSFMKRHKDRVKNRLCQKGLEEGFIT